MYAGRKSPSCVLLGLGEKYRCLYSGDPEIDFTQPTVTHHGGPGVGGPRRRDGGHTGGAAVAAPQRAGE
jgi:hypothetical protein